MHTALDYVLSLHFMPIGAAAVLPFAAWYHGAGWMTCVALCSASLLVSAAAFYMEPLLCLSPMGGRFNVGLREVKGDIGAMQPPMSVFYPTTASPAPRGADYIPFNDGNYLRGMARYVGMPYFLLMDIVFTRVRVRMDAAPVPLFWEDGTPRPLVLFSHGLAGFPRLYSTLLMDIAARGAIVFAVTHMDASAAYCRDAGNRIRVPLDTELERTVKDREPQLDIRIRETRNTIPRIRSGELLRKLGYEQNVIDRYVAMEQPVHLVGHSFGGATVLATALQEERTAKASKALSPVASVVAWDPWSVPLREKLFYNKLTNKEDAWHFSTPTLQIFSEGWMLDDTQYDFFVDVEKVVKAQTLTEEEAAVVDAANRKLKKIKTTWYTRKDVRGIGHLSYTDSALFSPVVYRAKYMTVPPRAALVDCAHDTLQFINTIAGPLPLDKNLSDDPVLSALLGL